MNGWSLALENFKSIRRLNLLEGRPLTLLVGPNNAGKSSLLQALLLLKGTLTAPESVLTFRNRWVDLGSYRDTVTNTYAQEGIAFRIELEGGVMVGKEGERERVRFRVDNREGVLQMREFEGNSSHYDEMAFFEQGGELFYEITTTQVRYQRDENGVQRLGIAQGGKISDRGVALWHGFLPIVELDAVDAAAMRVGLLLTEHEGFRGEPWRSWPLITEWLTHLRYLGPLPTYPERVYALKPVARLETGGMIDQAVQILAQEQLQERLILQLNHWMGGEGLGLVDEIRIRRFPGRQGFFVPETRIGRNWINLRDAGLGVAHSIPLVLESLLADRGDMLLVEQPELHLPPRAQAMTGRFLSEMARAGRWFLVETHSEALLQSVASSVREGVLPPDYVAIYFCTLNSEGMTTVVEIPLNSEGYLPAPNEWPGGFFDTQMQQTLTRR